MTDHKYSPEWWLERYNELCHDPKCAIGKNGRKILEYLMIVKHGEGCDLEELKNHLGVTKNNTVSGALAELRKALRNTRFEIQPREQRVLLKKDTAGNEPAEVFTSILQPTEPSGPIGRAALTEDPLAHYPTEWHVYHLTKNGPQGEFWLYAELRFQRVSPTDRYLEATASLLPPDADLSNPEKERLERFRHEYRFRMWAVKEHLIIQSSRRRGGNDMAVTLFPDLSLNNLDGAKGGMRVISGTWAGTPAMSLTLLSTKPLQASANEKGEVPENGRAILEPRVMQALEDEWYKWASQERFERLGTGIVGDERFTRTERLRSNGTSLEIWVAAYNLQNSGASLAFSRNVSDALKANASCGVHYRFLYPTEGSGSRIPMLEECFKGREAQLHLHPLPEEAFREITLVESHFIILNPKNGTQTFDAYMQLPLRRRQKGWIRLDPAAAGRVHTVMEKLLKRYPETNARRSSQ